MYLQNLSPARIDKKALVSLLNTKIIPNLDLLSSS